jgi:hypothetical protein
MTEQKIEVETDTAICSIHGAFYSGYCVCPVCKIMEEIDKEAKP